MQLSELFLTLAMFWYLFKSFLDGIDLCVDVTSVSINSCINSLVPLLWRMNKCLNLSWLLLCVERLSNLCFMKSTYTLMSPVYFCSCTWTHSSNSFRNTLVPRLWRMKMSEFVLSLAMLSLLILQLFANVPLVFSLVLKKQEKYRDRSVCLTQCEFSITDGISFVWHVCCVLMMLVYNSR